MTPSEIRGGFNDTLSIYFFDATFAVAFVARWCAGYKVETAEGVFRVRADAPATLGGGDDALHAVRNKCLALASVGGCHGGP
jgi:hypothetical protein